MLDRLGYRPEVKSIESKMSKKRYNANEIAENSMMLSENSYRNNPQTLLVSYMRKFFWTFCPSPQDGSIPKMCLIIRSYPIISLEQILIFQITDPSSLRTALETQIIIVKASQFFSVFTNVSYCTNFAMLCLIRLWRCLFCHRADVSLRLSAFLLSASWMYAVTVKPIFFFHFYQKYVSGDQTEYLLKTEVVFDTMCECQSWFLNKF